MNERLFEKGRAKFEDQIDIVNFLLSIKKLEKFMNQNIGRKMPGRISFDNNRFSKLEMTGQYSEDEDLTYQMNKEPQF